MDKNYLQKFKNLEPDGCLDPLECIPFVSLIQLNECKSSKQYEKEIKDIAARFPFEITQWPSFGKYAEDEYNVIVKEFAKQLVYCERGSMDIRCNCQNGIQLAYHIFKSVHLPLTEPAKNIAAKLDRIDDQRLLLWLKSSSQIFRMLEINSQFGEFALVDEILWMSEELARMEVCSYPSDAFKHEKYLVKGLMLSGLERSKAESIIARMNKNILANNRVQC